MGAVDYWCNIFTPEGLEHTFLSHPEVLRVVEWWGLRPRIVGRAPEAFVQHLDSAGVDVVMVPSAKMASYKGGELIWNVSEETVAELVTATAGRVKGLVGIDPREGMAGVRKLEEWVNSGFIGAHLHPYGFGLPVNHRRFYPFYAKCVELDVPLVVQVGHSAEQMPSAAGQPVLLDDVAIDFPELRIVGAHTGWPWIQELIAMAWKHPNVYIGTSAHHPRYWDPALVRFANSRGMGKVLFGSDFPVLDYPDAVPAMADLGLRDEAHELLIGGAARNVFNLDGAPSGETGAKG